MKTQMHVWEPGNSYRSTHRTTFHALLLAVIALSLGLSYSLDLFRSASSSRLTVVQLKSLQKRCASLKVPAGPPQSYRRTVSDRYAPGTRPVLIRNAKILTGARNGTELVTGDIFLDKGLIKAIGYFPQSVLAYATDIQEIDVGGAWVTPGLVDLHSHIGVDSAPALAGADDTNSRKAPILPWLRSIDGINTHDAAYLLSMSGGVTTAQVLPGSANDIGGQAYVIKLRPTADRSVLSKVVEPPQSLNSTTEFDYEEEYPRWRHMKHACGENPSRVYSQTRMDSAWQFRSAYDEARKILEQQNDFCARLDSGADIDGSFPESLQWEALVDVLRGRVKLSVHCYEAVDLDAIVRLSNEFKFPVASFHHAGETYLVSDLLKKTWGGAPSIALFASNFKKKREAYRGSEFAPRILANKGIPVVMKSDHPVTNSRYLLYEAQQAHYYGLHNALALASVTSTPAKALGLGHRVGTIAEGFDADLVIWDSHPLQLGATPQQVYVDGIPQLESADVPSKAPFLQQVPTTPNFDQEAKDVEDIKYDGLPPLEPKDENIAKSVVFGNVGSFYVRDGEDIKVIWDKNNGEEMDDSKPALGTVVVRDGHVRCYAFPDSLPRVSAPADISVCAKSDLGFDSMASVDLKGGSVVPALTTFGAPIGLVEIRMEASTNDGNVLDALVSNLPSILGNETEVIRAVDGIQFGGRNTLLAYRNGVTTAVTAPTGSAFVLGLSAAIATDAKHALEKGAIVQQETALHISIQRGRSASVSTQIAALRRLLFDQSNGSTSVWRRVKLGEIPLVIQVDGANIMATLIKLKSEYEDFASVPLKVTFSGATEAHLLAEEIARAGVSVIVTPSRPFPGTWDQAKFLPGPPLSYESAITTLVSHGVNVAIGVSDESSAKLTRFDISWAALESSGRISRSQAIALASTQLDRALGLDSFRSESTDLVAYEGGWMGDFDSKAVAVVSSRAQAVKLL